MLWSTPTSRRSRRLHDQETFPAGKTLMSSTGEQHAVTNKRCHQHPQAAQLAVVRMEIGQATDPKVTVRHGIIATVVLKATEVSIEPPQVRTTQEDHLDARPGRMIGRKQHTKAGTCLHIRRPDAPGQVLIRTFRATKKKGATTGDQGSARNRLEGMTGDPETTAETDTATANVIESMLTRIGPAEHPLIAAAAETEGHAAAAEVRREKTIPGTTGLATAQRENTIDDKEPRHMFR